MSETDDIRKLIDSERLPADFADTVEQFYRSVAQRILRLHAEARRTVVIGLCGPQGSGKSTMAAFLKLLLEQAGKHVALISIDDLYLTRDERERLAREVHPLLRTRGPPGTHDVALGVDLFDRLNTVASGMQTSIPRFDKAIDDRAPQAQWHLFDGRADIILFEGWCVGARPEEEAALVRPINALERDDDPSGVWRRYVNDRLAGHYQALFAQIDLLVMLKPPSFDCVFEWRVLQEDKLRERAKEGQRLMSRAEIAKFIMHYERVTKRILTEMPARTDIILEIDVDHRVTNLTMKR